MIGQILKKELVSITFFLSLGLAIALYWQGLSGPFLLDDFANIVIGYVPNPSAESLLYNITHNSSGMLGRSISMLSFFVTGLQFGIEPWGYKFHNLLLHLGCGFLIFRLLSVVLPLLEQKPLNKQTVLIAAVVSSFWLLHPLQVSTVLYVVQRMTQMAVFFTLLSLLVYLKFRQCDNGSIKYWLFGWVLFPLCMMLAVLSKEIGVLIPLYILLFECFVFRKSRFFLRGNTWQQWWLLVFVALPLVLGVSYVVTHFAQIANYSNRTFTLSERLLTQLHVLLYYMRVILLPRVKAMSLYLDDFPVTHALDAVTSLLLVALVLFLLAIYWLRNRAPVVAFGLAWFVVAHLLESTFIPLEMVFEHRNYLALLGLLLPLVYVVFTVAELRFVRWFIPLYLLLFMELTYVRVQDWSNEELLLSQAVNDHPDSARARVSYANFLFDHKGSDKEGFLQLQHAATLVPHDVGLTLHQIAVRCLEGEHDEVLFRQAISLLSQYPVSVYSLNAIEHLISIISEGKCTVISHDELWQLIETAINRPGSQDMPEFYGYLLRFKGLYALMEGHYAEGVIAIRTGHEVSGDTALLVELIETQITFQKFTDAQETLDFLQELNQKSHGIESYQVHRLQDKLAAALKVAEAAARANQVESATK